MTPRQLAAILLERATIMQGENHVRIQSVSDVGHDHRPVPGADRTYFGDLRHRVVGRAEAEYVRNTDRFNRRWLTEQDFAIDRALAKG